MAPTTPTVRRRLGLRGRRHPWRVDAGGGLRSSTARCSRRRPTMPSQTPPAPPLRMWRTVHTPAPSIATRSFHARASALQAYWEVRTRVRDTVQPPWCERLGFVPHIFLTNAEISNRMPPTLDDLHLLTLLLEPELRDTRRVPSFTRARKPARRSVHSPQRSPKRSPKRRGSRLAKVYIHLHKHPTKRATTLLAKHNQRADEVLRMDEGPYELITSDGRKRPLNAEHRFVAGNHHVSVVRRPFATVG